ncbi:MAG TPA: DUF2071 domain-containing protein [Verrucomicrobiae bacterium]
MLLDTIHGLIARRVLLNFRIDPEVAARVLPSRFRPKLYNGYAIGGVCMIRFQHLRPQFVPEWLGMTSENAAHRMAVTWEEDGELREGVFIPQRNTASTFNQLVGGRVFPGVFSKSEFSVEETPESVSIRISDEEGEAVRFKGDSAVEHRKESIFPTVTEAANFFSLGATGYSLSRDGKDFEGMELRSLSWKIAPLKVREAYSRWFADTTRFPAGSVELDCALVMRDIPHEWHSRPRISISSKSEQALGITAPIQKVQLP